MDLKSVKQDRDLIFAVLDKAVQRGGYGINEVTSLGVAMQRIGSLIDGLRIQKVEENGNSKPEGGSGDDPERGSPGSDSNNGKADEARDEASTDDN